VHQRLWPVVRGQHIPVTRGWRSRGMQSTPRLSITMRRDYRPPRLRMGTTMLPAPIAARSARQLRRHAALPSSPRDRAFCTPSRHFFRRHGGHPTSRRTYDWLDTAPQRANRPLCFCCFKPSFVESLSRLVPGRGRPTSARVPKPGTDAKGLTLGGRAHPMDELRPAFREASAPSRRSSPSQAPGHRG